MSGIKNFFNNLFNKTKVEASELAEKTSKLATEAKADLMEATTELRAEAAEALAKAKEMGNSAIQEIKETTAELKVEAAEGLEKAKAFGSEVIHEAKELGHEVIDEAKETYQNIKESDLVKKAGETIDSVVDKVEDASKTAIDKAKGLINDDPTEAKSDKSDPSQTA